MTKILIAVEKGRRRSTSSVFNKGETEMYNLETALIYHWHRKALSEEEILQMSNPTEVVFRSMIGFAVLAVVILCLSWAGEPNSERPLVAAAAQTYAVSAQGQ
jgi:hypothetical protein